MTCPSSEDLAALIDKTLPPSERGAVLSHLVDCGTCRRVVADSSVALDVLVSASKASAWDGRAKSRAQIIAACDCAERSEMLYHLHGGL